MSRVFGADRGSPIDRYYIEKFLRSHRDTIRGAVLEIADDNYTRQFGGPGVKSRDVLHAQPGNPRATIVGDLSKLSELPVDRYDCVICTQTLQFIYNVRDAILGIHQLLRPGGTALVTVSGISQISRYDMDRWGEFWRLTSRAAARLFEEAFRGGQVTVEAFGNVLAATAFLQGIAQEELTLSELDVQDADYEVIVAVAARK